MAKPKTDLSAALKGAVEEVPKNTTQPETSLEIIKSLSTQASRKGTVAITLHTSPEVRQQLKQIALDHQVTAQTLHAEAINLLFEKYSKPPIA